MTGRQLKNLARKCIIAHVGKPPLTAWLAYRDKSGLRTSRDHAYYTVATEVFEKSRQTLEIWRQRH